mmetsp:Transcript_3663/g.8522  ORF Transcript_3663/g.8522 Transcript_3663/m.8522 type:complete len:164 (-) Transcript_3663:228-719(-)
MPETCSLRLRSRPFKTTARLLRFWSVEELSIGPFQGCCLILHLERPRQQRHRARQARNQGARQPETPFFAAQTPKVIPSSGKHSQTVERVEVPRAMEGGKIEGREQMQGRGARSRRLADCLLANQDTQKGKKERKKEALRLQPLDPESGLWEGGLQGGRVAKG